MKAKLVKYPFNEKKCRWDTYKLGKEFEYYWDESLPNNFTTIEPYIKVEPFVYDDINNYSYIDLSKEVPDFQNINLPIKEGIYNPLVMINPQAPTVEFYKTRTKHDVGSTGGF